MTAHGPFDRTRPQDVDLIPSPLPASAVLAGEPSASSACMSRPRGDGLSVGSWECSAGSFTYDYWTDETVCIVSGSARILDGEGGTTTLNEGDWATFAAGDRVVWEIDDHVRKVWVVTAVGRPHSRVLLRARALTRRTTQRHGRVKPALAALSGSSAGFAGAVAVLPI